ncbi:MAG: hypothetical protein U5L45_13185 [Saprospiraceae bacterium]|nr:hypothetical protein [Saprospiraceae bacterium]
MKNSVTSIQARLRNLAQADGKNYQLILIRYFQLSENGKPYSNRNTHFSMKPLEQMKNVCFNGKHF